MNIIELFDVLKIDKNQILTFSGFDFIKIEKEINIERKINPDIDANVGAYLLLAIKNYSNELSFVVNNRNLFNLFTNTFLPKSSFPLQQIEVDSYKVKNFIEQFLSNELTLFLDRNFSQNKYDVICDVLREKKYFPDDVLYKLDKKILGKIDFAVTKLHQGNADLMEINFIKRYSFYELLSHFSSIESDEKLKPLINIVVEKYNVDKKGEFFSTALTTMASYKAFDSDLALVIQRNQIAVTENESQSSSSSSSGFSGRTIGIIAFILIRILLAASNCSSNDSNSSQNFNQDTYENSYNNTTPDYDYNASSQQLNSNMLNFGDFLTNYDSKTITEIKHYSGLKTGDNPFVGIYNSVEKNGANSVNLKITNNSNYDLIVIANYKDSNDFKSPYIACYIKSNDSFDVSKLPNESYSYNFCFGKNPATFNSETDVSYKAPDSTKVYRFLKLAKNANEIMTQDLVFTKNVTVFDNNGSVSWKQD